MQTLEAIVVSRKGKQWWLCPRCKRTLGEIIDGDILLVMVRNSWHFTFEMREGMNQRCPKCMTHSTVPKKEVR